MLTFKQFMQEAWKNEFKDSNSDKNWLSRGLIGKKRDSEDFKYSGYRKIGQVSSSGKGDKKKVDLYKRTTTDWAGRNPTHHYIAHDPESGIVTHSLSGYANKGGAITNIAATSAGHHPVKMHDVYHHILKHGHNTSIVGDNQSAGAIGVWNKLSKKPGITIHGWSKGKPVNLGKFHNDADEEETHTPMKLRRGETHDKEDNVIGNMKLVATYNKK